MFSLAMVEKLENIESCIEYSEVYGFSKGAEFSLN
jgi:hypothetical protein